MLMTTSVPRHIDVTLASIKRNLFSDAFVSLPDELECVKKPFPTNGDRYAAAEVKKRSDSKSFPR